MVHPTSVTNIINRLEAQGLVARRPNPADGRGTLAEITAAGSPGFSYVGMTSPADGAALPADPGLHEVFITTDGGSTWRPRLISSS